MIIRTGKFHWDTIIAQLKSEDATCIVDQDGSRLIVRNENDNKKVTLESILDSHDAAAALTAWNARKQRQNDASPAIRNMPNWGTWTPQEAEAWIELNVNSLASAKSVLKKLAVAVCYLRDHGGIV